MAGNTLLELRRDTAANWTSANPTLAAGEPGLETDTRKLKIGDGSTAWTSLGYFGASNVSTQTGTAYTAAITDAMGYLSFTNGAAITFTIPPNSSVPFPVGTVIEMEQAGAGALTVAPGAAVTVNSRAADLTLAGQYAVAAVKKVATDTWTLTGDL